MADESARLLVVDANVLIDYALADRTILSLASRHLGTLHVPRPILDEVDALSESGCDRLGLRLVDGSVEQLLEAGRKRGRLSFHDHLCLILARDEGWTCVTNDKVLRRACAESSIRLLWGLEMMIELVAAGHLSAEAALRVAKAIQVGNPRHITPEIFERLRQKLEG